MADNATKAPKLKTSRFAALLKSLKPTGTPKHDVSTTKGPHGNCQDCLKWHTILQGVADAVEANAVEFAAQQQTGDPAAPDQGDSTSFEDADQYFKDNACYIRYDQVWDKEDHRQKLVPSAKDDDDHHTEHAFWVRRNFSFENKYENTAVDIKSKALRSVIREVMKGCKAVSLEVEEPFMSSDLLFVYLEDLRTYCCKTLEAQLKSESVPQVIMDLKSQRLFCAALVSYLDKDYEDAKKRIYPLLESGSIEFNLLWALFKPNDIAVSPTYGISGEPRCLRVRSITEYKSVKKGKWYGVQGEYLEYDGKEFGWADLEIEIKEFGGGGPRPIASLNIYPIEYHKDSDGAMNKMIARVHKDPLKGILRFNVNGRVMIDSATFRRINPNYQFGTLSGLVDDGDNDDEDDSYSIETRSTHADIMDSNAALDTPGDDGESHLHRLKPTPVRGQEQRIETIVEHTTAGQEGRTFSDSDLLLASPVVLGFSFADKLWLEFSISGISDIVFNEGAFESLMLPEKQKNIVRALVESHKFNAAKGIDDAIRGKGKGLVSVLHGPPGTGKTLTAESISELLKCPLYSVSAGELGTDSAKLEVKLNEILDIASTWGAILLLDEADVFLERRELHDVNRNALVSIFLRLLEYFQGILFLTTNRVEAFDEAFQSRIHLPLRYRELSTAAKKAVWKMFLEAVRKADSTLAVDDFTEEGLDHLSRRQLNGRQIKNAVRTAQAIALREGSKLSMEHVKTVLSVNEEFERDLKGGTGYTEAMRSYT
ncbi:hypothetical protein LTR10_006884 [Elasticomyces elasticus]|nr:hypothetical protein LTR10_006884 [Elasticomyces elasticus]